MGASTSRSTPDSVDTNNDSKRDRHLKSQDFFSAKEFPKIAFKSTSATKLGDDWEVAGDFTLHGVTRPLTATVKPTGSGADPMAKKLGYETTFSFKRSDYGMTYGIGQKALSDEVTVVLSVEVIAR